MKINYGRAFWARLLSRTLLKNNQIIRRLFPADKHSFKALRNMSSNINEMRRQGFLQAF